MKPERTINNRTFSYIGRQYYSLTWSCCEGHCLFTQADRVDLVRAQFRCASAEAKVSNIAYCFMPDHVHQVVKGDDADSDAAVFVFKAKQYSGFYFKQTFQQRLWVRKGFNRILLPDEDPRVAVKYVLGNPVKAGIVTKIEDYPFSGSETLSWQQLVEWAFVI